MLGFERNTQDLSNREINKLSEEMTHCLRRYKGTANKDAVKTLLLKYLKPKGG